jgi:hypothetical protein
MITIQNQYLKATINPKGAELVSLIQLSSNIDFMWEEMLLIGVNTRLYFFQ